MKMLYLLFALVLTISGALKSTLTSTFEDDKLCLIGKQIIAPFNCHYGLSISPESSQEEALEKFDLTKYIDAPTFRVSYNENLTLMKSIEPNYRSAECIVVTVVKDWSLKNVSSLLKFNAVRWMYSSQIVIICSKNCSFAGLMEDFGNARNSDGLPNGVLVDLRRDYVIEVCASSKSSRELPMLEIDAGSSLYNCEVDLKGEEVPIYLPYNPPMTIGKNRSTDQLPVEQMNFRSIEEVEGLEVDLLKQFGLTFNFTIVVATKRTNKAVDYSLKDDVVGIDYNEMANEQVKISVNLQPLPTLAGNSRVLFTDAVFYEKSCVVLDVSLFPSPVLNLFQIFTIEVYAGMMSTCFLVSLVWYAIAKVRQISNLNYGVVALMVFAVANNSGMYRPLGTQSERILMSSFLLFNLVILNVFQGNLINIFNKLDDYQAYQNFSLFTSTGIPVLAFRSEVAGFYQIYQVNESQDFARFAKQVKEGLVLSGIGDKSYAITDFQNYTDKQIAILTTISLGKQYIAKNIKRNGGSTPLYVLDIIYGDGPMVFIAHDSLKFFCQIKNKVLQLAESGVISVWYQTTVNDYSHQMLSKKKSKDVHILKLAEVQICFFLYVYCAIFCIFAFIAETAYYNLIKPCQPY